MSVSKMMKTSIESKIESVTTIRKPSMAIITFISEFSRYLAQAEKDKEKLTSAGFDPELLPLYLAMFNMLNDEHAERIAAEGKNSATTEEFQEKMKQARVYKEILKLVLKYVLAMTNDSSIKAAFDKIRPGNSNADTLHDIQSMTIIVREHLQIASKIKPAGLEINEEYLDTVYRETEEILALEGEASASTSIRAIHVERQNKLITLCMDAIDNIKRFAEAAFLMDKEYYSEYYTNQAIRLKNSKASIKDEEIEEAIPGELHFESSEEML